MRSATKFGAILALGVLSCPVFAQLVGDLDSDGDVDADDVPTLGTALAGPGGANATGSAAFFEDPGDADMVVTMYDAMIVQQYLTGPQTVCDEDIPVAEDQLIRGWAGASYALGFDGAAGSSAVIDRELLQICTSTDAQAFASVWTGVHESTETYSEPAFDAAKVPVRWAQLGYLRSRNTVDGFPPNVIIEARFVEVFSADNDLDLSDYQYEVWALPAFARAEFRCERDNPTFGGWTFYFDTLPLYVTTSDYWVFELADTAEFAGEVLNRWDFMPGTTGNHCRLDDCRWVNASLFDNVINFNAPGGQRILLYPALHGATIAASDRVEIWDKR
ncbi:MAG: hypothetical protein R3B49_03165 [Phycisphaerales bacterium]